MSSRHVVILLCAVLAAAPLAAPAAPLPHFTSPAAIWNQDVSNATLRTNSALMMQHLEDLATSIRGSSCVGAGISSVCWGDSRVFNFQIDLSIYALHADASTPTAAVVAFPGDAVPDDPYYYGECDDPGPQTLFPVPIGGGSEGTDPPDYTCDTDNSDCHLLVVNDVTHVLYESFQTQTLDGAGLHTHCALRWDLTRIYPRYGRGEHCTSADGAGFPIAPLLFGADEVWAAVQVQGDLGHAIRFILGNNRMMKGKHVHPSSHGTDSTSDTNANAVPYGSRLRLKSSFNVNGFSSNEGVRVILRTLQKYGMFLSDGGGIPLTGEADYFDDHKWGTDLGINTHSLWGIRPTDFEVIEAGDPRSNSGNCIRTPEDFLFIDGNEY